MVSFFGLKFGDKKKKSDGKATQGSKQQQKQQQQQRQRIDQNALGEGQFFGANINQTTVINGSIRSVSRANTAMSIRSPYTHDTHNLAAVSMFDLSHVSHSRQGSYSSMALKAHASDAGLRTRFGANNASALSLAPPGPGFGSRPGTPNGKGKAWVNPLDVHFARSSPSVPPAQKSPLAIEVQPITADEKETGGGDAVSVFGEDADEMVDAMMASAKKKEEEEKAAKEQELEKEKELEKQKETARLEMERLERQKSTETKLRQQAQERPQERPQERRQQEHQRRNSPEGPGPVFRGNVDQRPGSRGGMRPGPNEQAGPGPGPGPGPNGPPRQFPHPTAAHQGPPRHAPPTQSLPNPPLNGGSRNYHHGGPPLQPGPRTDSRAGRPGPHGPPGPHAGPRPGPGPGPGAGPGPHARPIGPALQNNRPYSPAPQNNRPYSPAPNSPGFRGPAANEFRSQSPAHGGPGGPGNRPRPGPNLQTSLSLNNGPGPRGPPGPPGPGLPLRRAETAPSAPLSPTSDISDDPIEQFARPIIQDVAAKRDTMQLHTPRRHSLSMKIEELEKTLIRAQIETHEVDLRRPISSGSSNYSIGASDVSSLSDNDDEPILPVTSIQPAPLRTVYPNPAAATVNVPPVTSTPSPTTETGRWLPNGAAARGPIRRGPPPRRPTLDEYGVIPGRTASNSSRPPTRTASAAGSSSTGRPSESDESSILQRIPSATQTRSNTPQLRQDRIQEESPVVPTATTEVAASTSGLSPPPSAPAPILSNLGGFKFDFESAANAAPPTPDSTTWPLAPSSPGAAAKEATPSSPSASLHRANAPPPLNFNFSPDAYSRDPSGPWTPPLRSLGGSNPNLRLHDQERPSTAGGFSSAFSHSSSLAPAPSFTRSRTPVEGVDINATAASLGIGVARGLSIREPKREPRDRDPGRVEPKAPATPVDAFGTGFI
ncbi:hypothetical protein QBC37DRAFT_273755 [Rhypophila decipiens]|uniref:Uncharacterized protein n=1 Tax=Rhypophila decipiens TaxID=261697 RepID=A0AAN6YI72_9PEZI|nr:hypothetical protein QBC37DRAFT_273755 [Rhypophila decipiens]